MTTPDSKTYQCAAAMECYCGERIEIQIPVIATLKLGNDGNWRIAARVDDTVEWSQPMWDHALQKHGPALDA